MTFSNPLYNKIHRILVEGLSENVLYKSSFFLRHEDQEIVKFVSEIESEEHEISPHWLAKYKIETNTEFDKLPQAILGSIYSFKLAKVRQRIQEIMSELVKYDNNPSNQEADEQNLINLLSEQMALSKVDRMLSEKLGIIIR